MYKSGFLLKFNLQDIKKYENLQYQILKWNFDRIYKISNIVNFHIFLYLVN